MPLPTRRKIFPLAGEGQRNADGTSRQAIIAACNPGDPVLLLREPANSYDANAILVTATGHCLGYIARDDAKVLAPALDAGRQAASQIHRINGGIPGYPSYGVEISIAWDGAALPAPIPMDDLQLRSRGVKGGALGGRGDADGRSVGNGVGCLPVVVVFVLTALWANPWG